MTDRDLVAEERAAAARYGTARDNNRRPGMDAGTRRLALIAGGIGALLVATVGGWSLLGHHPAGVPLIAPPPGPVRVKPVDPGGMQLMPGQVAQTNGPASQALAPGPEAAAPEALRAEVDAARKADAPPPAPADPPKVAEAKPASPPATHPAAAAGGHAVQLAALDSEPAARAEWSRLARRAPALFADRVPAILHVSHGGRQFFRLRTGGFASAADATAFCGQLRASGLACTVADF